MTTSETQPMASFVKVFTPSLESKNDRPLPPDYHVTSRDANNSS